MNPAEMNQPVDTGRPWSVVATGARERWRGSNAYVCLTVMFVIATPPPSATGPPRGAPSLYKDVNTLDTRRKCGQPNKQENFEQSQKPSANPDENPQTTRARRPVRSARTWSGEQAAAAAVGENV